MASHDSADVPGALDQALCDVTRVSRDDFEKYGARLQLERERLQLLHAWRTTSMKNFDELLIENEVELTNARYLKKRAQLVDARSHLAKCARRECISTERTEGRFYDWRGRF